MMTIKVGYNTSDKVTKILTAKITAALGRDLTYYDRDTLKEVCCDITGLKAVLCSQSYGSFKADIAFDIDEEIAPFIPENILGAWQCNLVSPGAMYTAMRPVYGFKSEVKDYLTGLIDRLTKLNK